LDFLGAFWHLVNFAAPAACIGFFASVMAKIVWRRDMAGVSVLKLWSWSAGLACVAAIVALVVFGRDGKIVNYSAMVLASAAGLWWAGFVHHS
jgi:amino acid transporter